MSTELKGKVRVAKINMTEEGNDQLEEQFKIEKFPSIRFYKTGPKKVTEFGEYDGIRKKFSIL